MPNIEIIEKYQIVNNCSLITIQEIILIIFAVVLGVWLWDSINHAKNK